MSVKLSELIVLFFRLGLTAFGGPAAHIALFENEVVTHRKWLTREHFLDLLGITNLLPGPNSTQLAAQIGLALCGIPGMLTAGLSFIVPAVAITACLAWIYTTFGTKPELNGLWLGVRPAVLAIIAATILKLAPKAMKKPELWIVAFLVCAAVVIGWSPIVALFAGGFLGAVILQRSHLRTGVGGASMWLFGVTGLDSATITTHAAAISERSLVQIGLSFLKIGAILFGSGYVLIAYLREEFVQRLGWLTERALLDAVAVGQFTPGPVLSTATFIGFEMQGWSGAIVASVAIFLPSFVYVALLRPVIPRIRKNAWASAFLDAVNASAVALMVAVVLDLFPGAIPDWRAAAIAVLALAAAQWLPKLGLAWIVLGSALIGYVFSLS